MKKCSGNFASPIIYVDIEYDKGLSITVQNRVIKN